MGSWWGIIASFGRLSKVFVKRSPSYSSRLLLFYVKPKIRSYISEGWRWQIFCQLMNIHLCHADCHACYIRNTFCVRQVQHLFSWPSLELPFIITTFSVVLFCLFVLFSSGSCFLLLRKSVETGAREMYRKWRPATFCILWRLFPRCGTWSEMI